MALRHDALRQAQPVSEDAEDAFRALSQVRPLQPPPRVVGSSIICDSASMQLISNHLQPAEVAQMLIRMHCYIVVINLNPISPRNRERNNK